MAAASHTPRRKLSEADMAACVSYVDGDLTPDARLAFELRMTGEPELAAATQALLDTDRLLRAAEHGTAQRLASVRRMRPLLWAGSIALAACALVALCVYLLSPRFRATSFSVALAPGFESSHDFIATIPELSGMRPPGLDVLRGETADPNVGASEFTTKAHAAEDQLVGAALQAATREITTGYYVVPIELSAASQVVVYAVPTAGVHEVELAAIFAGRVESGRHVLPGERFQLEGVTDERVRYERGFLVPVGARELDVVVGVRARVGAPLAPSVHDADEAKRALEQQGFAVRRLRVREPAN